MSIAQCGVLQSGYRSSHSATAPSSFHHIDWLFIMKNSATILFTELELIEHQFNRLLNKTFNTRSFLHRRTRARNLQHAKKCPACNKKLSNEYRIEKRKLKRQLQILKMDAAALKKKDKPMIKYSNCVWQLKDGKFKKIAIIGEALWTLKRLWVLKRVPDPECAPSNWRWWLC